MEFDRPLVNRAPIIYNVSVTEEQSNWWSGWGSVLDLWPTLTAYPFLVPLPEDLSLYLDWEKVGHDLKRAMSSQAFRLPPDEQLRFQTTYTIRPDLSAFSVQRAYPTYAKSTDTIVAGPARASAWIVAATPRTVTVHHRARDASSPDGGGL